MLLPSLGRGASDFDVMAARIAAAGYRVLRPQPRGIGRSTSPAPYADLHDCAADIAAVIEHDGGGAALVAGHAFGNRVARMLATDRPELVRGVSLIAANVGHAPSTPPIREAIRNSANNALPDEERLKALKLRILRARQRSAALARGLASGGAGGAALRRRSRPRARRTMPAVRRRSSISSRGTIRWRMWRTRTRSSARSATA